jgi:predicted NBD/HSP70 family sugar kinase
MRKYVTGTDIGGSHISYAVIDFDKGIIIRERLTTQAIDNQVSVVLR